MNHYTITIEEDPETGDLVLPLNEDILKQMGWDFGDTLVWEDLGNGSWSLQKKVDNNSEKKV